MKLLTSVGTLLLLLAVGACSNTDKPIGDTSQNALDWPGIYQGKLPCSNCDVIAVTLELAQDNSYSFTQQHIGIDRKPEVVTGQFTWLKNGSQIKLDTKVWPTQLQVGENQLFILDEQGKRYTGPRSVRYILLKQQ
ncbi:copper resistance protein NlpE [Shewanella sp. AS1]|uniref:copper resistance protein NlpE n=1 Tax=Shewanella sp. AS1 TaxID=2907626 RepID=UPI001F27DFD6|nr:copper resistance protein NlpE [Shewanella sp. AS1]MCE9679372.1 copper resistance protein NlpE [Shewanella sp. AS1]